MLKLLSNTNYKVSRKSDNMTKVNARMSKRNVKRINQRVIERNECDKLAKQFSNDSADKMHTNPAEKMFETAKNARLSENPPSSERLKAEVKNRISFDSKTKTLQLSGPVGVVFCTNNINHCNPNENVDPHFHADPLQVFTICLIAFAELFISPETEWDTTVLNRVLAKGKKLYEKSLRRNKGGMKKEVLQKFNHCERTVEVDVSSPAVSLVHPHDQKVCKISVGLDRFFKTYKHCLCQIEGMYFFIWKHKNSYFIFDCYGRDPELNRNFEAGAASLICLGSTENLETLLGKMSGLDPNANYTLCPMQMKFMAPKCGVSIEFVADERPGFQIIDSNHATTQSKFHIDHEQFKVASGKQGLSVALMGMLYSKIDPPSTWNSHNLDQIMMLGFDFYKTCVKCNNSKKLLLRNIPANIQIGQFVATIEIVPSVVRTVWNQVGRLSSEKCTDEIKRQFIEKCRTDLLIHIGEKSYGIWKRDSHFYVLDPYRTHHYKRSSKTSDKNCTVHMFTDLDTLCRTLMSEIIQIPFSSTCILHAVNIVKLQECTLRTFSKVEQNLPAVVRSKGLWSSTGRRIRRVKSLNESVVDTECDRRIRVLKQLLSNSKNSSRDLIKTVSSSSRSLSKGSKSVESFSNDVIKSHKASENRSQNFEGNLSSRNVYMCSSYIPDASERDENVKASGSDSSECSSSCELKRCKSEMNVTKIVQDSSDDKKVEIEGTIKSAKFESSQETNIETSKTIQDLKEKSANETEILSEFSDMGNYLDAICQVKTPYYERSVISHDSLKGNDFEDEISGGSSDTGSNIDSELDFAENLFSSTYLYDYKRDASPGCLAQSKKMAVVGSVCGSYESLKSLLSAGFKVSDRIYVLTPWRNYVIFELASNYFVFNGCACNPERFRTIDLSTGTAGFLQFTSLNSVILKMRADKSKNKSDSSSSISN